MIFRSYAYTLGLSLVFLAQFTKALIPNLDFIKDNQASDPEEPGHLSLPNLLQVNELDDLSLNWETYNNLRIDTGRLIFENGAGSVWSTPQLANTRDEWTIETIFRYSKLDSKVPSNSNNGLSFWLVDSGNSVPINDKNIQNFGGPTEFDGFQFLINNKEATGLKIFANDGTHSQENSISKSIGDCAFNYLQSDVPFTLRVSYSKSRNWFKVQIDNNLCFKTESIQIPDYSGDFKFGVSSYVESSNPSESFELFGIKVWTRLTTDAIDDHGLISDGQIKVDYKTVTVPADSQEPNHVGPSVIRKSLMEKQKAEIDRLGGYRDNNKVSQDNNNENSYSGQFDNSILIEISNKLANVENTVNNFQIGSSSSSSNGNYDIKILEAHIREIQSIQEKQSQILLDLQQGYTEFKSIITQQSSQMMSEVSKLNEKVVGEVREQQYGMDEINKKVDLLMANHKEVSYQYKNQDSVQDIKPDYSNIIIKWILIPIFAIILILTIFVYRLRHDIKHSKLL